MEKLQAVLRFIIATCLLILVIGTLYFHWSVTYISKYPNGQLDTTTVYLR